MTTKTKDYKVELRVDGIIHVHYNAGTKVTVETLKELQQVYAQITTIKRPFIFTGDEFVSITTDARRYAAEMDQTNPSLGHVFVAKNLAQKILAQYYFKFNRPKHPLKVVGSFEEGIHYIHMNYQLHEMV